MCTKLIISLMGREVTGVRVDHKPSPVMVKPNGVSHDADQETNSEVSGENTEVRDHQVKEAEKHEKSTKVDDQKSSSPHKPASGPIDGNVQIKNPAQENCGVENDRLACVSQVVAETPVSGNSSPDGAGSPTSLKKSELNSPFVPRKLLDDDDNWSLASSYPFLLIFLTIYQLLGHSQSRPKNLSAVLKLLESSLTTPRTAASVRTTRSRTTVPVAPTFKSAERLERRKQFYAKLEEKHRALEAEKREYEARTKEEEEAAIKQLRKSMVVRANPVPGFYYESPPSQKELKKVPTTRAKSPKIGRRKSFGDAVRSSPEDKVVCSRAFRRSLGSYKKEDSDATPSCKKKDHNCQQVQQDATNQADEAAAKAVPMTDQQMNSTDVAVHS
ncbi:hypothetical protein Dimus_021812 [Dionaea muscipula]